MFKRKVARLLAARPKKATESSFGWDNKEQQRRRLMAFVKNIQVAGKGIRTGTVNAVNEFTMNVDTFDYEDLTFEITGKCTKKNVTTELDHELMEFENSIKIAYIVTDPGRYVLDIKYQGIHVPCSPFQIEIQKHNTSTNAKEVVAFGKGLQRCMAGKVNRFHVDMRKSGHGRLSIVPSAVGENEVPSYIVTDSKHGYQVQYVTTTIGPFFFHIKLNGKHIPGSPFLVTSRTKEDIVEKAKMLFRVHAKNRKRL